MALTSNDYKATLFIGDTLGKEFQNVFYIKNLAGAPSANDLQTAIHTEWNTAITQILHDSMYITGVEILNLGNPADFGTFGYLEQGLRGGEYMPDWVGWAFELKRPTTSFRHGGRKVIGRIAESDVENGAIRTAGIPDIVTPVNAVAALWDTDFFTPGGTGLYHVCLPFSTLGQGLGEDPTKYYLRDIVPVNDCRYKRVSSQKSRQTL